MRQSWDRYFMDLAIGVSTRATCDRKHVGAVIVLHHRVLSTGYNGSLPGLDHCDDVGHIMVEGHCLRTVHAESNAVAQAARHGIALEGGTCYVTASPCIACFKLLVSAGIVEIVSLEPYGAPIPEELTRHILMRVL